MDPNLTLCHTTQGYSIRTCLAKQDQAGSYMWVTVIYYDKHFSQGVWLWDCKFILQENTKL